MYTASSRFSDLISTSPMWLTARSSSRLRVHSGHHVPVVYHCVSDCCPASTSLPLQLIHRLKATERCFQNANSITSLSGTLSPASTPSPTNTPTFCHYTPGSGANLAPCPEQGHLLCVSGCRLMSVSFSVPHSPEKMWKVLETAHYWC